MVLKRASQRGRAATKLEKALLTELYRKVFPTDKII
jgi:hypothetical protein